MKNRFKVIILWAAIALVLQFSGLFYVNNYFLSNDVKNVETQKIEDDTNQGDKPIADIYLPNDREMFKVSNKAKYISYVENNEIKIINTQTGEEKKTNFSKGSYYQWISDRNRMLIGLKKGSKIELSFYDVDKDIKEKIQDIGISESGKLTDIKLSPLTQVKYLKVEGTNQTTIFRLNIMDNMDRVSLPSKIGNIFIGNREDKLIYDDLSSNSVHVTESNVKFKLGEGKNTILGMDLEDNVYIANVDHEGIIKSLSYGSMKSNASLQKINVPQGTNYKNIHVSDDGNVYVNENLKGILKDLKNNKEISYKGKFMCILRNIIVSESNQKLIITKI